MSEPADRRSQAITKPGDHLAAHHLRGPSRRAARVAAACVIAAAVFLAFAPSLKNGFINWDDDVYVTENPTIRALSWQNLRTIFNSSYTGVYIPLTILSFAVEYRIFGLNPLGYHLDSLILHVLNALLVLWLVLLLTRSLPVSVLTALFFGLHPLRVESVAWATERKDVLFGFFFLLSALAYLYYVRRRSRGQSQDALSGHARAQSPGHTRAASRMYYILSLAAFALAVFSKPMAVTLPLILFLFDFLARRRFSRESISEKIPFVVIAVAFVAIEAVVGGSLKVASPGTPTGIFHRISIASFAVMFYVSKALVPVKLAILYPYTDAVKGMLPTWFHFAPLTMLAAGFLIAYSLRYTRKVLFGCLFALFAVAPVLQFIPVPGDAIVADRHTYMMAVGIAYLVAEGLVYLYGRRSARPARYGSVAIAAGIIVVLFGLTFQRSKVWKDSIAVWSDVFSKYRIVAPIAYYNRAEAYSASKQYTKAIHDLKMAVELNPDYVDAHNNLGIAYAETGDFDAAIAQYNQALAVRPGFADAYYNRAMAHIKKKDFAAAAGDFSDVISLDPANVRAYMHRGNMYAILNQPEAAIRDYSRLLEAQPDDAATYNSRANMFAMIGEHERAIADYTTAIAHFPGPGIYAEAYRNRAMTYFSIKDYDKAWGDVDRLAAAGVAVPPDFLSRLREASGRSH